MLVSSGVALATITRSRLVAPPRTSSNFSFALITVLNDCGATHCTADPGLMRFMSSRERDFEEASSGKPIAPGRWPRGSLQDASARSSWRRANGDEDNGIAVSVRPPTQPRKFGICSVRGGVGCNCVKPRFYRAANVLPGAAPLRALYPARGTKGCPTDSDPVSICTWVATRSNRDGHHKILLDSRPPFFHLDGAKRSSAG
jgi:hypothetical protein